MTFKAGDKVVLKPNQSDEPGVLAWLEYGKVYTVRGVGKDDDGNDTVRLRECRTAWLATRFQLAAVPLPATVPATGDEIEVVVRAKVSSVQRYHDGIIVYFCNDDPGEYIAPIYLNNSIQALTVIEPAKPKLDLDALPYGAVVEGLDEAGSTNGVYRKIPTREDGPVWAALNGLRSTAADLYGRHAELIELVRREVSA